MTSILAIAMLVWSGRAELPAPCSMHPIRLGLSPVSRGADVPAEQVLTNAVEEARALWAPYGVRVEGTGDLPPGEGSLLTLALQPDRGEIRTPASLAWIPFSAAGMPEPTIVVFYRDLRRLSEKATTLGVSFLWWPPALRDAILGRMLGRVLAHEIGHYVLRSPHHSDGLMRAIDTASMLADPDRRYFVLTRHDRERLHAIEAASCRSAD